ncbi:MAG: dihydroorotase [Ruminococcaceae bacterium]|nr:dihydroorotase [Oscillospiraceae bacterium]
MRTIIKNINLINYDSENICDIIIDNKKIEKIGKNLGTDGFDKIIDGSGKIAFPGLFDIHCHLRDPGYEYKEDIESGSKSAAKGGFTGVLAMPNTKPTADNKTVIDYIYKKIKEKACIKVYQSGAISKGLKGEELAEMGEMQKSGIIAVTDDGKPVTDSSLMKKALIYANMLNLPVISHAEDLSLVDNGAMNEGFMATYLGLRGINKAAEETMTARDILIAKNTNTAVHITHVSTKGSVEIIRNFKKQGVKVTCDTCPHYFSLTDKMCDGFNTNAKMNPPLRDEEDVLAIIEGLKDGTIDMIGTDHAPHHIDEKNLEFDKALNGIIGFETAFNVAYKYLHKGAGMSLCDIIKLMSYNPNKFLKLDGGEIKEGVKADLVIASIDKEYEYKEEDIVSKSKNTPYIGFKFLSKIENVFVDGKDVLEEI